mmetsp:Transcript_48832/g.162934  ORF Transcript_48832/g.162934 Transcript_48832/m.162934 type:complete len:216 (+) Transcript_48832:623-1270(+)
MPEGTNTAAPSGLKAGGVAVEPLRTGVAAAHVAREHATSGHPFAERTGEPAYLRVRHDGDSITDRDVAHKDRVVHRALHGIGGPAAIEEGRGCAGSIVAQIGPHESCNARGTLELDSAAASHGRAARHGAVGQRKLATFGHGDAAAIGAGGAIGNARAACERKRAALPDRDAAAVALRAAARQARPLELDISALGHGDAAAASTGRAVAHRTVSK